MLKFVFPDAGPLISLAQADALDLLLAFDETVQITITDFVCYETTSQKDKYLDAHKIAQFLTEYAGKITIEHTSYGKLILDNIKNDPNYPIPDDAGEMSIMSLNINYNQPSIIIFEDKWFVDRYRLTNLTNIVSTSHFVNVALNNGVISSARHGQIIDSLKKNHRSLDAVNSDSEWEDSFGMR